MSEYSENKYLRLDFPDVPPGLNGPKGLIRLHRYGLTEAKRDWFTLVMDEVPVELRNKNPQWGSVVVIFTVKTSQRMDRDNIAAAFKFIGDALVRQGLLLDDNATVVKIFHPKWEYVEHRAERGCTVEIFILDESRERIEQEFEKWLAENLAQKQAATVTL